MCLLGDKSIELLLGNNSVGVKISSFDHLLESIVVGELSQILSNLSQVFQ